ncbi:MAG: NAD-dependent epimerase/dehydratase family protein, partial [Actinomycetota bacterium]|nr:NAD-dependent epimerase/dehydratase family protein [Actinomycetota bacterium]
RELVELHERISLPARPARVACVAVNTAGLDEAEARAAIDDAERGTGLPADDPVRYGAGRLVDAIVAHIEEMGPAAPKVRPQDPVRI